MPTPRPALPLFDTGTRAICGIPKYFLTRLLLLSAIRDVSKTSTPRGTSNAKPVSFFSFFRDEVLTIFKMPIHNPYALVRNTTVTSRTGRVVPICRMREAIIDLCHHGHITTADREEQLIALREAEIDDWLPGFKMFYSCFIGKYVLWPKLVDHVMDMYEIAVQWTLDDDDGSVSDPMPLIDYWKFTVPRNIGMFRRNWDRAPHPVMVHVEPIDEYVMVETGEI